MFRFLVSSWIFLLLFPFAAAAAAAKCSGCWREEGKEAEGFVTCIRQRPLPTNRCACPDANLAEQKQNVRGGGSKATMYSGAWIAPWNVFEKAPWSHTGPLEWASWHAFGRAEGGVFRTSHQRGLWLHHMSAYEHSVLPRYENGMDLVRRVAEAEVRDACGGSDEVLVSWPLKNSTVAVVPFYGGELNRDTGNAHSRLPRELKLIGLLANVCSLLSSFASLVVVAACPGRDVEVVKDRLAHFNETVKVFEVECKAPAHLPFEALSGLSKFIGESKTFVAYTEADQVLRWGSREAANSTASFLSDFERTLITPHRWHKRYGSKPDCGSSCGMSVTGQNQCYSRSTNVDRLYYPHRLASLEFM